MSGIHQTLSGLAKTQDLPGFVAMASHRGETVFCGAYGQRGPDHGEAMATDQVFFIASMTKAVTTVAALQLVEQGLVDLDQDLGSLIPALAAPKVLEGFDAKGAAILRPAKGPISLRQLLSHTSGLGYDMWNADLGRYVQDQGIPGMGSGLKAALNLPLAFDPGTAWEYGIGLDWAGQVIEVVSGKALDVYVRDHITGPLGMTDTAFLPNEAMTARLAGMAARTPDGDLKPLSLPVNPGSEFWSGGGGLYSTASDYLRFLQMILDGGTAASGAQILTQSSLSLLSQNHKGDVPLRRLGSVMPFLTHDLDVGAALGLEAPGWGLGLAINPTTGPNGRSPGSLAWAGLANTYYWADPERQVAGVFMSQLLPFADPKVLAVFAGFERGVYETL
jgi:CubicO group peptidase (beta-lactamase class C family)